MALQSKLLGGDSKLEAASLSDLAHILPGTRGTHVGKIQQALIQIDGAAIIPDGVYGKDTAAAVRAFKAKPVSHEVGTGGGRVGSTER